MERLVGGESGEETDIDRGERGVFRSSIKRTEKIDMG